MDAQGQFELAAGAEGPFLLRAFDVADGFLGKSIRFGTVEEWRGGELVLFPNANPAPAVHGRMLAPSWEGLASMKVTLHISPALTGCTCVSRTDLTDGNGDFDFGPIAAGAHRIVVVDPEGRFQPQDRFPIQPGDVLELALEE